MTRTKIDIEMERRRLEQADQRETVVLHLANRRSGPVLAGGAIVVDWGDGPRPTDDAELAALVVAWAKGQVCVVWPFAPAVGRGRRHSGTPLMSAGVQAIVTDMASGGV